MPITSAKFPRSCGLLMHISSLPGNYGIGTFGKEAYHFIDFLAECRFSWWQTLPFGPVDECGSPYKSLSAFMGNPNFIDLEALSDIGLLHQDEVASARSHASPYAVDVDGIRKHKEALLRLAYQRINSKIEKEIYEFSHIHPKIKESALYQAISKSEMELPWTQWKNQALKKRDAQALKKVENELKNEINYQIFVQYLFFSQWANIKTYANEKDIQIIGDLPIYVDLHSADVWMHPEYFSIDADGHLKTQAGVPPDYFSEEGQLWANPLYNWEKMAQDHYIWWKDRLKTAFEWFDVIRIDHFRAFSAYWSIPGDALTAKEGHWEKGPSIDFFNALNDEFDFSKPKIIAEDLGTIDDDVIQLIQKTGFPGMRVLQFGFMDHENNPHLPHQYPAHSVAYTGTHDNNTLLGWLWEIPEWQRQYALNYIGFDQTKYFWGEGGNFTPSACQKCIETLWRSHANLTIIPIQDLLGYGSDTRMNIPGVAKGNWTFRITREILDQIDKTWIQKLNQLTFR